MSKKRARLRSVLAVGALPPIVFVAVLLWAQAAGSHPSPHAHGHFLVTKEADTADGVCDADCSLREAVMASEAQAGWDHITVPAGTYVLTRSENEGGRPDEVISGAPAPNNQNGSVGDLDLTDTVSIAGAGADKTIIDGGDIDRVFDVLSQSCGGAPLPCAVFTDMTVRNGTGRDGLFSHTHGGVYHIHGRAGLENVAISAGEANAHGGGGLINAGGAVANLKNVTVTGNKTPGTGGGIQNSGTLTLTNVTISENTAPAGSGGGLYSGAGSATLVNTIVADNAAENCGGTTIASAGNNLAGDTSCNTAFSMASDIKPAAGTLDAKLAPLEKDGFVYLYTLLSGSPAIDKGSNASCPPTDEIGVVRPQDGDAVPGAVCDIGAAEVVPAELALTKTDSPDPVAAGEEVTYTITVTNNGPGPAADVTVTDTLPGGVTVVSTNPACTGTTVLTCPLGTIPNGGSAVLTIVVRTSAVGTITNSASVSSAAVDLVPGNNADSESTDVRPGCFGRPATIAGGGFIVGTPGTDVIVGSNGPDYILALAGDDVACGRGGLDWIDAGDGADRADGEGGPDTVIGGNDADILFGGLGNDLVRGFAGNDTLNGDTPTGADPNPNLDVCEGNSGTDTAANCEVKFGIP